MKSRLCLLMLVLVSFTSSFLAYGQGPKKPRTAEDYQPRTLKELSTLVPDVIAADPEYQKNQKEQTILVLGDLQASRVKVQYDGTTRPLPDRKKGVVKQWADRYAGMPEFYTGPYEVEALFSEAGEHYWLAVRPEFLQALGQPVKSGESFELFVIKLGGIRMNPSDQDLEPVILVEKFVKQ